ncbi:MAG: hypothetical protein M0Z98_07240 [Actinomycetales bacterium]|nr:hypothetical protein [Actinomycetales bacterium]
MRLAAVGTTLAVVLALAACSSGGGAPVASSSSATVAPSPTRATPTTSPTPTSASPTTSPVDSATPDASTSSPAPVVAVTDYGATLAVWATHHKADERFDPGAMWDATSGWGPDEANDDKFNDTVVVGGRVLRYDMYLPRPAVAAATAIALATATLPRDATVVWRRQFATCYAVQLSSATLGKLLAGKPFANPQGQVQLQLRSGSPSSSTAAFDPAAVTSVRVRPTLAATAADFAGC